MSGESIVDFIPSWLCFALSTLGALAALEFGLWLGARHRPPGKNDQKESPIGSVVGALLGLLAFMMAFTFGVSASRYDSRKQLLLEEVNAIGTTFLRAGLLPEPHNTHSQRLLREYVSVRVEAAAISHDPDKLRRAIARSEAIQDKLWVDAEALAEADRNSEISALFISSLNELIDLHTMRVVFSTQYRIPIIVWLVLSFVSLLAMAIVGFQFGQTAGRNLFASLSLALAFSAVIALIHDLDRTVYGSVQVSQQPMIELEQKLNGDTPSDARQRIDDDGVPGS